MSHVHWSGRQRGPKGRQFTLQNTQRGFVDVVGMKHIYKKFVSAGTDGAAVMRSVPRCSGLDCDDLVGTSFSAFLKQDLDEWLA